jgi:DNA-binding beta-propeller fold protein YncE
VLSIGLLCLLAQAKVELVASGFQEPFGVDFDAEGGLYVVELSGQRVKRVGKDGAVVAVAGTGKKGFSGDGGPALQAEFNGPHHLLVGRDGGVYVADTWNHCVRRFDPRSGVLTRVEGSPATEKWGGIYCIAFDARGEQLYAVDLDSRKIRRVTLKTGVQVTVAGNGSKGVPKDGAPAAEQPLVDPRAAAVDSKGNLYILERGGHALRVVDAAGRIRTVAGTGKAGLSGDGGDALQAQFNGPKHIAVDRDDTVLVADAENHVIRRYHPADGRITRVCGTGKKGAGEPGSAPEQCALNRPHGIQPGPDGALYVTDSYNHRILRIR